MFNPIVTENIFLEKITCMAFGYDNGIAATIGEKNQVFTKQFPTLHKILFSGSLE